MLLYEVLREFVDVDGKPKVVGQLIEVEESRAGKLITSGFVVPAPLVLADSLLKIINDKIGADTNLWNGHRTVLGYSNSTYKHIHNPSYVYPDDCTLVDAVTSATENTFGDFVELVPENGIPVSFDIHWANIQNISANGTYIVELHQVSNADLQVSEKYLGSFSVSRQSNFTRSFQVYTQIPVVHANTRIGVRAKKSGSGAGTISFNTSYHDYE